MAAEDEASVEAQDEGTAAERPDWLPTNFQTPEDLAKSWENANRKITEQGQRNAELEARAARADELEAYYEQIQAQSQQGQQETYAQQLAQRWEEGDGMTQLEIQAMLIKQGIDQALKDFQPPQASDRRVDELAADTAQKNLAAKYDDFGEYASQMGEIVQQDPWLKNRLSSGTVREVTDALESVYKLTKANAVMEGRASLDTNLAELNRQVKNQAQTMSGQSQRQEETTWWDKIKASDGSLPSFRDVK